MTLEGLGRCLKVTLQTREQEMFCLCRWKDEQTVKRAQTLSKDPHRRERILQSIMHLKTKIQDDPSLDASGLPKTI